MAYKTNLNKGKEMLARINKRKADREAKKTNAKLEEGTTEFRLMPAFNEEGDWCASGFFHYGFSDIILCPTTFGEEEACPVCELVSDLWKGTDDDKEEAKRLGRKMRYFINIMPIACKKPDDEVVNYEPKVKILGTTEAMVVKLAEHMGSEDYGDITDPKTGRNIRIKRTGTGKNSTRYGDPIPRPNPSEVPNFEELSKTIPDLIEYVHKSKKTYEEIQNILENVETPAESDATDDSGADEAPAAEAKQTTAVKDSWDDDKPTVTTQVESKPVTKKAEKEASEAPKPDGKPSVKDRLKALRNSGK